MTSLQNRYYQDEAEAAIWEEWEKGNKRTLLVLPTGTGKTIVFAKVAAHAVRQGERVLVLAHRGELLDQAADKIGKATGLGCSVEKADQTALGEWFQITVGSVQTLMREKRLERFPRDFYGVIIVDEAHHVLANSYQVILEYFGDAKVLGVTATPDRGDMRELGEYFDSLAYEYPLPRAIKDGFLCPIRAQTIPIQLDMNGVKQQAGDFSARQTGDALEPYLERIADEMAEHCRGRKTVVFLPLIATSQKFAELLSTRGFRVAEVNGNSPDRAEILQAFDQGEYDVLCNSMLLTEGWDCPSVDCIVCLRPTKIRSLYCQMVGRGTRLHEGKDHLLLLDFLWLSDRHELCRPAHLIAHDKDVADKMTANIAAAGCPMDLEAAESQAEGDCAAEREAALAKELARMKNRQAKLVDPVQFEMSIQDMDLANYRPAFGWESKEPSKQQRDFLERAGILPDTIDNAGKAEKIIKTIQQRRDANLATPKQIRFLERKGFQHVGQWSFDGAKKLIDRIAANSWRVPNTVDPGTYRPEAQEEIAIARG
jgi:superfamily II DNA or RNA helicase